MIIQWLTRILRAFVCPLIEDALKPIHQTLDAVLKEKQQARQELREQDTRIRGDMVLEMQRVGQALAATNHQVVMLQHEIALLKLGTPIIELPVEPRTPGQVDWEPHPAHFGNKIDLTPR